MFGMGMGEIVLIAVVALLVLGPERLPSAAKSIGKGIRDLRRQTRDLQSSIEADTEIGSAVKELRGALRGDPETLYERVTGERFDDSNKAKSDSSEPGAEEKEKEKEKKGEDSAEKDDSAKKLATSAGGNDNAREDSILKPHGDALPRQASESESDPGVS